MRPPRLVFAAAVLASVLPSISFAGSSDDPESLVRAARYRAKSTLNPARSGLIDVRRGHDGHFWVKPLVNGKDVGWFMFDTGKTGMSIDPAVARELGLVSAGETELYGIGGVTKGERFRMASFDLGPFHAVDLEAENMLPVPVRPGAEEAERPVGVVGSYVLRDVVTVIDLAREAIAIYAPNTFRPSGIRWLPTRMRPDVPAVEVKVSGRPTWLLVDTGMPGAIALFDPEMVGHLGLVPAENTPNAVAVGSDGRPLDLRFMFARSVEFAGETRQKVRVTVPMQRMAPARATLQGLMGNQMLAGRTIVIDGPRKRVGLIGS